MTAAIVRTLWLARMPYQGWDSSSRRSMEDRNATQAPAVGPPRIIAAPTNGRWKVIVDAALGAQDAQRAEEAEDEPEQEAAGGAGEDGSRREARIDGGQRREDERGPREEAEPEDDRGAGVGQQPVAPDSGRASDASRAGPGSHAGPDGRDGDREGEPAPARVAGCGPAGGAGCRRGTEEVQGKDVHERALT